MADTTKDAGFWVGRGKELYSKEKFAEAIEAYDKAIELEPDSLDAWLAKGHISFVLGDEKTTLAAHDKALELDPNLGDAWVWLTKGYALYVLGDREKALDAFDMALKLNPDSWNVWDAQNAKAATLFALGRRERPPENLPKVEKIPGIPMNPTVKGKALIAMNKDVLAAKKG